MDFEAMRCFVALAETLHFGQAADRCFISPSAFTRVIQRVEDEASVKLVQRSNREVMLTRAGEDFLGFCRESLARWEAVRDGMTLAERQLSGDLRIFATVTASYSILPPIIDRFRRLHPGVTIRLKSGDVADAFQYLRSGEVDCAVVALPGSTMPDFAVQELTTTPLVFVAPRDRAHNASLFEQLQGFPATADWSRLPLILPQRGLARTRIDAWFRRQEIRPNVYAQVSGNEAILAMVKLGLGLGLVPELVVVNSPLAAGLDILPHIQEVPDFLVGIAAKRSSAMKPAVSAFFECGRLSVDELPAGDDGRQE